MQQRADPCPGGRLGLELVIHLQGGVVHLLAHGIAVAAADTLEAKQAAATNASNAMSQKVYNTTLKMYNKLQAKTVARAWVSSLLH